MRSDTRLWGQSGAETQTEKDRRALRQVPAKASPSVHPHTHRKTTYIHVS